MKENFDKIMESIMELEGGYVNDPDDPGGETKYGISKRAFPKEDIKNLTPERAKELYRKYYWDKINGDDLPDKLDACVMDTAVNEGVGTALKLLKRTKNPQEYLVLRMQCYLAVVKKYPPLKKYLYTWMERVSYWWRKLWAISYLI